MRVDPQGPQEPLEAVVLDDLPPPRGGAWRGWLVAVGAFALFLVLFGAALWGLGKLLQRGDAVGPARAGSVVQRWEAPDERLTNVKAALAADEPGCSAAELRGLERFFSRVQGTLQTSPPTGFEAYVDFDAWSERVVRHPAVKSSGPVERTDLEQQLLQRLNPPGSWTDLHVVSAQRGKNDEELLVYTVIWGGGIDPAPVRWWLARERRSWLICDWEPIGRGYSEAARWALERAHEADVNMASYRRVHSTCAQARQSEESGNLPLATQQLHALEELEYPAALHDLALRELAITWHKLGRPDKVHAACDRLSQDNEQPGVHYLRALAYAAEEQFAEAAEAAAQYRELAGPHPHLLAVEAEALEAIGKPDEARERLYARLLLMPENVQAITDYCRLAGEHESQLATALQRGRRPAELAAEAAAASANWDDRAFEPLLAYLKQGDPESAMVADLEGSRLEHFGKHEEAAKHFRRAIERETDEELRDAYRWRLLSAMASAMKATEGYLAEPDAVDAFETLTAGFEEEESLISREDLPALIEAHRRRAPDDPRLAYFEGLLLLEEGKAAEAEQLLVAAEENADDEDMLASLRSLRGKALCRQGKFREALELEVEGEEPFYTLAWELRNDEDWQSLAGLLQARRQQQPDDPWIGYYEALRQQAAGDEAAALATIQSVNPGDDDSLKRWSDWLETDLLLDQGDIDGAYTSQAGERDAFRRLAGQLTAREAWPELQEAATLHRQRVAQSSTGAYWLAKAHFEQGQYAKVTPLLSPWTGDRASRLDADQHAEVHDMLVRSWLRQGKVEQAREAANTAYEEYGLPLPLLAVELATGEDDKVRELLGQPWIAGLVFDQQLHGDPELGVLLTDAKWSSARRSRGVAAPFLGDRSHLSVVLLFEAPLALVEAQRLIAPLGDDLPEPARVNGRSQRSSLAWHLPEGTLLLTVGGKPYAPADDLPSSVAADDPRRRAIAQHQGWAAVDLIAARGPGNRAKLEQYAGRLAAALAESGATLVSTSGSQGRNLRLALADAGVRQSLADATFWAKAPPGESVWLYEGEDDESTSAERQELRQSLMDLAQRARVENPAGYGQARLQIELLHASERPWVKIVRARRDDDGYFRDEEFLVEMTEDSRLCPFLQKGERLRVGAYMLRELRPVEQQEAPQGEQNLPSEPSQSDSGSAGN